MSREDGSETGFSRRELLKGGTFATAGLIGFKAASGTSEAAAQDPRISLGPDWEIDDDGQSWRLENPATGAKFAYDSQLGRWVPAQTVDVSGGGVVDGGTTVYDESTDTVGDGSTSANHQSVDTGVLSLGDPTLVYAFGEGGNLRTVRDPANFADVFAAVNDILNGFTDSDQPKILLPYTGTTGISASTTLDVASTQKVPSLLGYGQDATVINFTATGSPAIKVNNAGQDVAPEWADFTLAGPGKGATGSANGIDIDGTISHGAEFHRFAVRQFAGDGINADGFITCEMANLDVQRNGGRGIVVERLNGGQIKTSLVQKNGNATGSPQMLARDCIGGTIGPGNVIDSRGGDGTLSITDGLIARAVNKRGAPLVFGNYFEDSDTHLAVENGGVAPRAFNVAFNRFQSGNTGLHVADDLSANGDRGGLTLGNEFSGLATQDILFDGGDMVLGPNQHVNSTTVLTDNVAGDYASVSKTSGSYPW